MSPGWTQVTTRGKVLAAKALIALAEIDARQDQGKAAPEVDQIVQSLTTHAVSKLPAEAEIRFTTIRPGERVFRFDLLPSLRVSAAQFGDSTQVEFIQEDRRPTLSAHCAVR